MADDPEAGYNFEPTTKDWSHDQFRDSIVEAVRSRDIAYSAFPNSIDLGGPIGVISNKLLDATLNDSEMPEYGTFGKVSLDGRLLISNHFTRGVDDHVVVS